MSSDDQIPHPSQEATESAKKLFDAIQMRFPTSVSIFEARWTSWLSICNGTLSLSTSLEDYTKSKEFGELKSLGPKIIPFIVFKLASSITDNFYGVFLYNDLESKPTYDNVPDYRVTINKSSFSVEALQILSSKVVELNYQRNKIVQDAITAWTQFQIENGCQSNTVFFTCTDEYECLLEFGPSIIGPIMVEYFDHHGHVWWALLHEMIHGHKMAAYMISKSLLFEEWCQFFDEGGHAQAYKYVQTPWDRAILHGERSDIVDYYREMGWTPPGPREKWYTRQESLDTTATG